MIKLDTTQMHKKLENNIFSTSKNEERPSINMSANKYKLVPADPYEQNNQIKHKKHWSLYRNYKISNTQFQIFEKVNQKSRNKIYI